LLYLPHYAQSHGVSVTNWVHLSPFPGLFAISLGIFILFYPHRSNANTVLVIAISTITLIAISMFGLLRTAGEAYDVRPISYQIKTLEASDIPVAVIGKYAGTYDFVGRLTQPPENIEAMNVTTWFETHANGRVIAFFDQKNKPTEVEFIQIYKGQYIAILTRPQWLDLHTPIQQNTDAP
jgi:hypothetical protein